jgi:hypothetical protein
MSRSVFSFLSSARRSVLVVLGATLLALVLVVVASAALAPKKADAATAQVVTKTFNKPAAILIPAGAGLGDCDSNFNWAAEPYPSIRSVQAFPSGSTILDVNLVLRGFSHTHPDDVDVLLTKGIPKGSRARTLMSDVGSNKGVNDITLTLDDEADEPLPEEGPLVSGRFKPTNLAGGLGTITLDLFPPPVGNINANPSLNFEGLSPNGQWKLRVADDESADCGEFAGGWSLIIKARVP